ncbi:MAG TPA: efflux RND transporter periplasmic adaptor subunit [Xanthobacteraceae bacterium]|jgi:multidrug efflux system membrane fusion protein|nr:efflux RND transporter periplasmic adaptor subunit [Xanthobacteraceae bacterium]
MKRLLLATMFVALLVAGYVFQDQLLKLPGMAGFGTAKAPEAKRPAPAQSVSAGTAIEMSVPILVNAIGTVQSIASVIVKSRIDGQIAEVHLEEGQEVKEGDLLFTLDNRSFQAQLAQADANVERSRAQLERAQQEVKRQSELASRGVASAQRLEEVQSQVKVFEAAIRADEAAIENARINLSYTQIRSPIAGKTGVINLKRGNLVKSNDTTTNAVPLVTITQLRPIYVGFTVPERHLADIREAMTSEEPLVAVVTLPNQPQKPITGALTFIDNQVDVVTGTISLKAKFANDDTWLWPGQFVNVTLTVGIQANAIVLPSGAVQIGQNGAYVFVIKQDSTVELRLVRTNRTVDDKTVIDDGIKAGERVVVDGQLRLTNGARVTVQAPQRPAVSERKS